VQFFVAVAPAALPAFALRVIVVDDVLDLFF
jgi:hypothetical protein